MVGRIKSLPSDIRKFLDTARRCAQELRVKIYLVGGIVRDMLLGYESVDYDIVVEGDGVSFAQVLADKVEGKFIKHMGFGTATVYYKNYRVDIATCRKEYYPFWGALPRVLPSDIKHDLFRRDFTINAMAIGLNRYDYGHLIDFYGGYRDLKRGFIRVMHDMSFLDDPTRLLRAIRFEVRFSFRIEPHTLRLFKEAADKSALKFIDEHRLRDELILMLKEPSPFRCLRRLNELAGFSFIDEHLHWHKNEHLLFRRISNACRLFRKRLAIHHRFEEWFVYLLALIYRLPRERAMKFCHDFGLRKGDREKINSLYGIMQRIGILRKRKIKRSTLYRFLSPVSIETLVFLYGYFKNPVVRANIILFISQLKNIHLHIKGEDLKQLGLRPFTLYGRVLKRVLSAKLNGKVSGRKEELAEAKKVFERLRRSYYKSERRSVTAI